MFRKCGKLRVDIIILYHIVHEQQICMLFELCCMHNSVAYYLSIMKCMRENVVKRLHNMIKYNVSYKQITYYIYTIKYSWILEKVRAIRLIYINKHKVLVCNCVFPNIYLQHKSTFIKNFARFKAVANVEYIWFYFLFFII